MARQPSRHSKNWGGSRKGSGRPDTGIEKRVVSLNLSEALINKIDRELDRHNAARSQIEPGRKLTRSEFVEQALNEWFSKA